MINNSRNPNGPWKLQVKLFHRHEDGKLCEATLLETSGIVVDKALHGIQIAALFRSLADLILAEHASDVATPVCRAFFENPELLEENPSNDQPEQPTNLLTH